MFKAVSFCGIFLIMSVAGFAYPTDSDSLATIRGRVGVEAKKIHGSNMNMGVPGAVVQLFYKKDGKIDSIYTTAGRTGDFIFRKIEPQRIGLKVQSMGYESVSGVYDIAPGDNFFLFNLKEKVDTLQGATITAEIPLIRQIEDTTIYNTQIIKHADTDDLRQVLEMLPGFVVRGDAIIVDGHPVSRTYVNGILVFGDKVTTAVDALKADEVKQVRVYDELSDVDKHRGIKNAKKNRVLDIITKDAIISMTLASVGAAGGADCTGQPRYAAAGLVGFHSEMLQSQTVVSADNINKCNEGSYSLHANSFVSQKAPLDANRASQMVSLTNSKYWKNRYYGNSITVLYSLSHEQSKSASTALKEYYGAVDVPIMTVLDTLSSQSNNIRHYCNASLRLNDTPLKSFVINFTGSITGNRNEAFQGNLTQTTGMQESRMHQDSGSNDRDYSAKLGITWTNNDTKKWRPFIGIGGNIANSSSLSWTVDTLETSYLRRKLSSDGYGRGAGAWLHAGAEATLANDKEKTAMLWVELNSHYDHSVHRQLSYNEFGVDTPVMDMANSYDFTHNQLANSVDSRFSLSLPSNRNLDILSSIKDVVLFDIERLPGDFDNTKHFPSVSCVVHYISPKLFLAASSEAVTPAIEQIRNRISDANPLALTAGNPSLKQGYNVSINATYRPPTIQQGIGRNSNFEFTLGGNITFRPIVARVLYFNESTALTEYDGYIARAGSILNTFDNARQPRINLSAQSSYTKNILKRQLKLVFTLGDNYLRNPMYNGDKISPMDENAVNGSLRVYYTPSSKLRIFNTISSAYLLSTRRGELLSSRFRIGDSFDVQWYITDRLRVSSKYDCTGYVYTAGTGRNHFSQYLTVGIETPFLKDKSLNVGLWGYDILNSGSLYTTEVTSAMMSQTWTPTYGRNIMLKIWWNMRVKQ